MNPVNTNITDTSDQIRWFEIGAVILIGGLKFLLTDLAELRLPFILGILTCCGIYVLRTAQNNMERMKQWGFRLDNFSEVMKWFLVPAFILIVAFYTTGYFRQTTIFSWHIIPILLVYPIWGVVQQFLMIGIIASNLARLQSIKLSQVSIIVITATLFSLVHYPNTELIITTLMMSVIYTYVFLRKPNLYALGLLHGILGAVFYYTVLGIDPFIKLAMELSL